MDNIQNLTVFEILRLRFPESSTRTLQSWLKWGRVLVDGTPIFKGNAYIKQGQALSLKDKPLQTKEGIPILYQDRWLIVIEKPAGLLSVPTEKNQINAMHLLKIGLKTSSVFPVHRLDQESSGIMMFARSKLAEEKFNLLFEKHNLEREYIAIVEGHITANQGTWECYVREKENFNMEVVAQGQGKKAITHFEVIRRSKKFSYLLLRLETGRKHQIRLQASAAGHPILGDKRYHSLINPFKRLCLHARRLSFTHPFTQRSMNFISRSSYTRRGYSTHFPFDL